MKASASTYFCFLLILVVCGCHLPNPKGNTFEEKYGEALKHNYNEEQREGVYQTIATESLQKFEAIQWREDVKVALAEAQAQQKPILAFFVVNEFAKKGAKHC